MLTETFSNTTWILITLAVLWSIPWKAVALWQAARNSHKGWFIALLIINTVGILEIIYIFGFSKKGSKSK
ncbi:MAG: DUF5652 family protein [Candidatus Gracilibacteria bacterium]|nr:DUF5652 family protein [Candidatus Gracilibacteria bacterium]